jgi:hypothetical protein
MDEYLFILFVPAVHPVPIERDEILDRCHLVKGIGIAPDRVFGHLVAGCDRPIGGCAFIGAEGVMIRRGHQIETHIGAREVVDRQMPCLEQ